MTAEKNAKIREWVINHAKARIENDILYIKNVKMSDGYYQTFGKIYVICCDGMAMCETHCKDEGKEDREKFITSHKGAFCKVYERANIDEAEKFAKEYSEEFFAGISDEKVSEYEGYYDAANA